MNMIPKNWDDITLEDYTSIYKTLSEEPKTDSEYWELTVRRVCYLTGKDPNWVDENMTMDDLSSIQELIKTPLPQKLIKNFSFNGRNYRVDIDPRKYTSGRYMSVMNQLKDEKLENLHKVIYQVCTEVTFFGKKVEPDLDKLPELIESFKQLPMKVVNPITVFFSILSKELTAAILQYSTSEMQKATEALKTEINYLEGSDG